MTSTDVVNLYRAFSAPLPPQISSVLTPNHVNEEFWSTPASFGSGWRYTDNAPTSPNGQCFRH